MELYILVEILHFLPTLRQYTRLILLSYTQDVILLKNIITKKNNYQNLQLTNSELNSAFHFIVLLPLLPRYENYIEHSWNTLRSFQIITE